MGSGARTGIAGNRLPADIHFELVETLFGTVGSFLSGVVGGLTLATLALFRVGGTTFVVCAATIVLLTAFRVGVFVAHARQSHEDRFASAKTWEKVYALGGIGFMLNVGMIAALLLYNGKDELSSLYGIVSVLGCAGAVAGRNCGRPFVVVGQILGLCLPTIAVLPLHLDLWYCGLSLILVLVISSVLSTTRFLNETLVSALLAERESRRRGWQLGIALDSMTHGLCMAAADGSITVVNRRLRDAFGLSESTPPATLDALARAIASAGGMSPAEADGFARGFRDHVDGREPRDWSATVGARIFTLRFQPMDSGGSVVVVEDVTEARRSAQKVEYLAHYDPLTGLANRFQFHQDLTVALRDVRPDCGVALLSIDLDRFKEVNDTLGHPTGDALLRQVAERLRAVAGPHALVARFGGDEFQVLVRSRPALSELFACADDLIARLSEPYVVEGHAVSVGASIGIATAPEDACGVDDLLRCADMALYGAKSVARGTSLRFTPAMDADLQRRRQTETELRDALCSGQIEVFYQPTVDLRTGRVSTCEALVRWRHPTRGLVPPDSFIPVAEDCGLIADLGEFVLRRACEDAALWPQDVTVAVNVSPKQFVLRRDLVDRVGTILAETGLAPGRLEVEITESTLLDAKPALAALAGLGVRISLDDFGTGYSGLSYLRLFEIHKIKIDRSFVRIGDRASLAIIEAVSSLARALDLALVVEGVETPEQLRTVADRRIHLIQGYLFSKPRPLSEIRPMLDGTFHMTVTTLRALA